MNSHETRMSGGRQRGFTLIELLVTIAVLAIAISLGVPMYGEFTRSSTLSSRTSELISALNFARSQAVASRRDIRLEAIDDTWSAGWQVVDETLVNPMLRIADFRSDTVMSVTDEVNDVVALTYDREGRVDTATEFIICVERDSGEAGRKVIVERFGRVKVETFECVP
jgi:type IV fimbrial biogenesis protein FimT